MDKSHFMSPYSPNTDADRAKMLKAIDVKSSDDLFEVIPAKHRNPKLNIPEPTAEMDLKRELEAMANANAVPGKFACFLGGGAYRHHIPSVVKAIISRGEFLTSYTPYQPEISQGTLQTAYEFQTLVCQLTGMEVANTGMYDGATALAEAALMAARLTHRDKIAVLETVSPKYLEVIQTYSQALKVNYYIVPVGQEKLEDDTACLLVQQPNFYGYMEDMTRLSERAHSQGALFVVSADPTSLGMFKAPGEYDADIVVSEGQAVGVILSFGGPYTGFFACKEKHLRQMPGRIVGKTVDTKGRTGYVLTLQTREQHIRREKATSNICTSVALIALMSTVYMAAMGKQGMKKVAELCYHKAHYAASLIEKIPGYSLPIKGTFFREFVVKCPLPPSEINHKLLDMGIIGGMDISKLVPNGMLVAVTETNSREEIEQLAAALKKISSGVAAAKR